MSGLDDQTEERVFKTICIRSRKNKESSGQESPIDCISGSHLLLEELPLGLTEIQDLSNMTYLRILSVGASWPPALGSLGHSWVDHIEGDLAQTFWAMSSIRTERKPSLDVQQMCFPTPSVSLSPIPLWLSRILIVKLPEKNTKCLPEKSERKFASGLS